MKSTEKETMLEEKVKNLIAILKLREEEIKKLKEYTAKLENIIAHSPELSKLQIPDKEGILDLYFVWESCSNMITNQYHKIVKKIETETKRSAWNCTALGNKTIPKDTPSRWRIKINKTSRGYLMIGIALKTLDKERPQNYLKDVWALHYYNGDLYLYDNGNYKILGQNSFKDGKILEIIANIQKGILHFNLSDANVGGYIVNIDPNQEYVPYVELCDGGDEVELL